MLPFRSLGNDPMLNLPFRSRILQVAAVVLTTMFSAGCTHSLALQHAYFAEPRVSVARIAAETRYRIIHLHAVQMTQRACTGAVTAAGSPDGSDFGAAAARGALADICAASTPRPAAWHGGTATAFRRWVEDRVLELPAPSETAASAGAS